jgi:ABC-type transport system substrate-binding protein
MRARILAFVVVLGLVAGACSSGGGGDGGSETPRGAGEPQYGGRVVYGLEADTTGGFAPAGCVCAVSGHQIMKAVYDTLTLVDSDGTVIPNLATSWSHNDDYTEWTFTLRDGVQFHDGTPLNGDAIIVNIGALKASFLTQTAVRDIDKVTADGQTFTLELARPVANLPVTLATQLGYVASPKWLAEAAKDTTLLNQPVGTGPFVYASYTPGNGNSFVAKRNANYWRDGLPFLDEVEFRVLEDIQSRSNALRTGEIDAMHTSNADEIAKFRKSRDSLVLQEITNNQETAYVLLHVGSPTVEIAGATFENALTDVRVRRALAFATDNQTLIESRGAGIVPEANGPFPPGTTGYLEDTGYPKFDLDEAKRLVAEWEAENGPLTMKYATTNDPFNRLTAELLQRMWKNAGIDVTIDTIEQSQFIIKALTGEFQAFGWRNHGRVDPILEDIWWTSETAVAPPGLSLNFGRIGDEEIDAGLAVIRESDDPAARKAAAEAINRRFGEQAYNLWTSWVLWAVVSNPKMHDLLEYEAPDGVEVPTGLGIGASHFLTYAWVQR